MIYSICNPKIKRIKEKLLCKYENVKKDYSMHLIFYNMSAQLKYKAPRDYWKALFHPFQERKFFSLKELSNSKCDEYKHPFDSR